MARQNEELARAFRDPGFRLNNLYRIIDRNGQEVLFKMNPAQQAFYDEMWYYNIVLKARQLGFTTLIDLIGLDMALFTPNFTAVIIAETKEKAADIFTRKIIYPYEHLSEEIRKFCRIINRSKDGELVFSNGSSVKVMVSARSGTCQFLHVSEYGPVCARQPAKAVEIKTGSLPAVHAGSFVFIESTAMGNYGDFYDMTMAAQARKLTGRRLNQQEYRMHFFPWHSNPEYVAPCENVIVPDRLLKYFDELYSTHGIELSPEQQAWYTIQEAVYHEKMWSEYPSYIGEAFKVAQDGSYYARQFHDIYRDNRITVVPYISSLPVYTGWDLGISDEMSIWFAQFLGKEVRIIDYYQNNGEGLPFYAAVLRDRGYKYARHFAPHDIGNRELTTGISRQEAARQYGLNFDLIRTNIDVIGGIDNCREMLDYCWFDESKTEEGLKCLQAYKKEWDDKHACYKSRPLHDWSSHGADSFRTLAVAWKMGLVSGSNSSRGGSPIKSVGGLKRI